MYYEMQGEQRKRRNNQTRRKGREGQSLEHIRRDESTARHEVADTFGWLHLSDQERPSSLHWLQAQYMACSQGLLSLKMAEEVFAAKCMFSITDLANV